IIYEADTPSGLAFDIVLLFAIIASVIAVVLESVPSFQAAHGSLFRVIEWTFTILFTIEYALRIYCIKKPKSYIFSFFGIIDFLSIIPTYLSLMFVGAQMFLVLRILRLLRVFRILKLSRYVVQADILWKALKESRYKIIVFLFTVVSIALVMGAIMYIVEGPQNGFESIPHGMYWAIVTLTTVGFGDIVPHTILGQFIAGFLMILGYGIIAVPTGIVSVELAKVSGISTRNSCENCGKEGHDSDAKFCKYCGEKLV
ncbi:ion transporter, partial [Candidatus Woesearchaeota archaeon]|nr:ion transporter [Candidatus Woesearchaeota archaeon]